MRCPNGHENPDGIRVCSRCAALLPPSVDGPSVSVPWTPAPPASSVPPAAPAPPTAAPPGPPLGYAPGPRPPAWPGYAPGYGPGYAPGYGPGAGPYPPRTPATNGLAVASLVLGILWLCGLGSALAVVFGMVALRQIGARNEQGRGLAIAGLVLGGLGTLSLAAFLVLAAIGASTEAPPSSEFEPSTRNTLACEDDTKVLKTAILAWKAAYDAGGDPGTFATPYPPSQEALTLPDTALLSRPSELHDFTSKGGRSVPVITKRPGQCRGEEIVQLN